MPTPRSPWLFSKWTDLAWLFAPVWATWAICFVLPKTVLSAPLPLWTWAVFILGIDVSHVWSTIYRTYFDPDEWQRHGLLFKLAPLIAFGTFLIIAMTSLYGFGSSFLFWRLLAYLALYHFVKQQYGFLALYRTRSQAVVHRLISDKTAIYLSMIWPVIYWHISGDRAFGWMINHDFFDLSWTWKSIGIVQWQMTWFGNGLYWSALGIWLVEELRANVRIPWGKVLWMYSTALNWWLGIVWFNSDLAFSLTNVVAHGIPYMALVFFYVEKKKAVIHPSRYSSIKSLGSMALMIAGILALSFVEEYHWDMLINRQKQQLFETVLSYPIQVITSPWAKALAISVLSTPQVTHYILDGYIWKGGKKNPYIKEVFAK